MASIWQHPKTVNLIARFRGANGKTVNRSTGTPDKVEAKRIASGWESEAARERAKQTAEVSPGGISDTIAKAERMARQGRLNPASARDLINDLLAAAGQQAIDAVTNRTWCSDWKASKKGAVTERTRMKYDQVSRDWLTFLGQKADNPMETTAKADALGFRDKAIKGGLSARTANQAVKLLRGIYAEAVEQGHISRNPFAGVDALREDSEESKREPFTVSEVAQLIKTAEGDWRGLVILAASSGLRLMDAARLQWKSVDLEHGLLRVTTGKTKAKLMLPIHPEFKDWLEKQTVGIASAPVFPTLASKGGAGKSGLSMAFKRIMERAEVVAGIAREADEKGRGRSTAKKSFHSLRHFAVTQLAAAGVRGDVAMQITGHSDVASHSGYVGHDADAMLAAVRTIRLTA